MRHHEETHRDAVLERRARRLARVATPEADGRVVLELALVRLGEREVGLPARAIREITVAPEITPLPAPLAAGGELLGLAQIRGELIGVADLGRLVGEPAAATTAARPLVIAESEAGRLGLLVDAVLGYRGLREGEIAETFHDRDGRRAVPVAAVTTDLLTVLDLEPFLAASASGSPR